MMVSSKNNSGHITCSKIVPVPRSIENFPASEAEKIVHKGISLLPWEEGSIARYRMYCFDSRTPPFIIFSPTHGICLIDVRDWSEDVDITADEVRFRIEVKESTKSFISTNPRLRYFVYIKNLISDLWKNAEFRDAYTPETMPIKYAVALPFMSRRMYNKTTIPEYLPGERVIFREDLKDASRVKSCFDLKFPALDNSLTQKQMEIFEQRLAPEINFRRLNSTSAPIRLNLQQEEIAKSIDQWPIRLSDVEEEGKSATMLCRAKLLAEIYPDYRILILSETPETRMINKEIFDHISIPGKASVSIYSMKRFITLLAAKVGVATTG